MTAPRDFEPVRATTAPTFAPKAVHVLVAGDGKHVLASTIRHGTLCVTLRGKEWLESAIHESRMDGRQQVAEGLLLPLTPPPDALERMAKAIYVYNLSMVTEVSPGDEDSLWRNASNDVIDECLGQASRAFAALVEGEK